MPGMLKWGRWLVVLAALLQLGPALAQAPKRYALVIGNDTYRHVEPLQNARNDARLFAQAMRDAQFEVIAQNDLGREQFWNAIDRVKTRVHKGDEVVFFFAGHGVQIGSTQYLLPVDVQPPESDRQVERNAIPLLEVLDSFNEARVSVFVIDACRDNPFPKRGTRSIGGTRGMVRPDPATGQVVIMSAGRDQKALDSVPGGAAGNGLFTHELVRVIRNGNPEVRGAFETVKERVDDLARRANHQQRPAVAHDLRGNFHFFPGGAQQLAGAASTASPAPAMRLPSAEEIEQQAWEDAQRAASASAYEAFLGAYPSSRYAGRARIQIAALSPRPSAATQPLAAPAVPAPSGSPSATPRVSSIDLRASPIVQRALTSGRLTLGVREGAAPLSYNLGNGAYAGYHVELCRRIVESIESATGRRISLDYLPLTSSNRIPLVQNGTVDLECGTTTNNATRQRDAGFLNTTYVIEVRMAVRADSGISSVSQLAGKRIATTTGTTSLQSLRRNGRAAGVDFHEVYGKDHRDSFQLMESGRADVFVMDDTILAGLIASSSHPGNWRIVGETLGQEPVAIMLRREDTALKDFGNAVLAEMASTGELARLYDKWFVQPIPPGNTRVGLPASSGTRSAWSAPNDRPMEAYLQR